MTAIIDVIKGRLVDHQKALQDEDLTTASRLFCEDAVVLAPDTEPCVGRKAILDFLEELSKKGKVTMEYRDFDKIQAEQLSDDYVTTMCFFFLISDGTKSDLFKTLEIWKKNEEGQWCIYRTAYNTCPE